MQENYIEKVKAEEHDIVNSINNEISKKKVFLATLVSFGFVAIILVAWILYSHNRDKELQNFSTLTSPTITPIELPSEQQDNSEIDTTNWQTYTNEEYGISFEYPTEFKLISENSMPEYDFLLITSFVPTSVTEGNETFSFSIRSTNTDTAINNLVRTYPDDVVRVETVRIDDAIYKQLTWEDITHNMHQGYVSFQRQYLIDRGDDTRYEFSVSIDTDSVKKMNLSETLEEIMKTVSFE